MATKNHYPDAHPRAPWRVFHHGKVYWFKEETGADDKIADLQKGAPKSTLTAREVDEYLRCKELLQGTPLLVAARYFVDRHPAESRAVLVKDAADRFHAHCDSLAPRPKTTKNRKFFLKSLVNVYGDKWVGDVGRGDIEKLLAHAMRKPGSPASRALSPFSRNNTLRTVRQFFNWAKDSGLVRDNPTDWHDGRRAIEFVKTRSGRGFFTIPNLFLFLETCARTQPQALPAIALQAFAGVRTQEVMRMVWGDVQFTRKLIVIRDTVAKIEGQERVIDWWPDALDVWFRRPAGAGDTSPIVKDFARAKGNVVKACAAASPGFVWGQNTLRHSYATYGCAFHQSADRMKLLMGQRSDDVFFLHYRRWADQADGVSYFSGVACPWPKRG